MLGVFFWPGTIAIVVLAAVYLNMGTNALLLAAMLSVLEITLSFDNAVVNAKILKRMSQQWQQRFLTWGILIAVFGTRVLLPILIVAIAAWASPFVIASLAIQDPVAYGNLLAHTHHLINAFGGTFLLMVSLKYFFDQAKEVHWFVAVERRLALWGRIEAIEIAGVLSVLLGVAALVEEGFGEILAAGIVGVVLFILMEGITQALGSSVAHMAKSGLVLFLYLNVLDTAFSLDGVVGAFALSSNLFVIAAGLGIGALFVRTITIYLVRARILEAFIYLEHGAHWAIFGLAFVMLLSLVTPVPGVITGGIGLCLMVLSYLSSRKVLHSVVA
jgi:hypothetical protein